MGSTLIGVAPELRFECCYRVVGEMPAVVGGCKNLGGEGHRDGAIDLGHVDAHGGDDLPVRGVPAEPHGGGPNERSVAYPTSGIRLPSQGVHLPVGTEERGDIPIGIVYQRVRALVMDRRDTSWRQDSPEVGRQVVARSWDAGPDRGWQEQQGHYCRSCAWCHSPSIAVCSNLSQPRQATGRVATQPHCCGGYRREDSQAARRIGLTCQLIATGAPYLLAADTGARPPTRWWSLSGRPPQTFSSVLTSETSRRRVKSVLLHKGVTVRSIPGAVPVIIAGAVGMGAGVGIGLLAASHGSVATPGGTVTTSVASSAHWSAEGAQLVRETHANWAYESIPLDITGDGTYLFDFGPVPGSFDYPSHPTGMAFDWPPDSHFSVVPGGTPARIATLRGKRYFQIGFTISSFSSPYSG